MSLDALLAEQLNILKQNIIPAILERYEDAVKDYKVFLKEGESIERLGSIYRIDVIGLVEFVRTIEEDQNLESALDQIKNIRGYVKSNEEFLQECLKNGDTIANKQMFNTRILNMLDFINVYLIQARMLQKLVYVNECKEIIQVIPIVVPDKRGWNKIFQSLHGGIGVGSEMDSPINMELELSPEHKALRKTHIKVWQVISTYARVSTVRHIFGVIYLKYMEEYLASLQASKDYVPMSVLEKHRTYVDALLYYPKEN